MWLNECSVATIYWEQTSGPQEQWSKAPQFTYGKGEVGMVCSLPVKREEKHV